MKVVGTCWQSGNPDTTLPKLVIIDQGSSPGANGWMFRLMDWTDAHVLHPGDKAQLWNERDSCTTPQERQSAIAYARSLGLQVVYGGDVVDPKTGWSYVPADGDVLAACDFYGLHVASWSPPAPAMLYGKPVIVTEVEQDPNNINWSQVVDWMRASQAPCFYFTFMWRGSDGRIDLAPHPDIISQLEAMNVADFVIGPGFKAEIEKRGWHPASDEVYFSQTANAKLSVISCDEGLMFYDSANNKIGVLPFS